ncbi:hypothetical protein QCA50_016293 [Cerrena zonata]|uniref:Uncharacterized protein n=1 Tax=Cerrena zonata TaxID=2478898 RepID=A0AAW0FVJ0_9APHY
MEWGHRLLGRTIALYFWKTRKFSSHVKWKVVGLTALLGLQGAIGWWMVKSGLDEEGAAFLLYLGVLWTAFEILNENKWLKQIKTSSDSSVINNLNTVFEKLNNPALKRVKLYAGALLALTFITAMSGGMVAGLDAGLIYNTFPLMEVRGGLRALVDDLKTPISSTFESFDPTDD